MQHAQYILDEAVPPKRQIRSAPRPKFVPPPDGDPVDGNFYPRIFKRVIQLASACRLSQKDILEYIQDKGQGEFASLHHAPWEILSEVARAWPDIVVEISRVLRRRRRKEDGVHEVVSSTSAGLSLFTRLPIPTSAPAKAARPGSGDF